VSEQPLSSRHDLAVGLVLGLASLGMLLWVAVKPSLAGVNSDAAVYLLLADWLSPWRATDIDFGAQLFSHYPFPPLYPLLLAIVGGGSATPVVDYVVGVFAQGVAVAASFVWARRVGCTLPAAIVAALSLAITPIALFTAMGVFSEPVYLALSMTALALVSGSRTSAGAWHGAALLLGLAAVTRSVGFFAVLALLLAWLSRTRGRSARLVPLLALAPLLLWQLTKTINGWAGGYTTGIFSLGLLPVTAALLAQLPTNLHALAYHFVRCFDSLNGQHSTVLLTILVLPAGLCLVQRLRGGMADAWYAVLYVLVLLGWPHPNHFGRFLLILLPLFCAYASHGLAQISAHGRMHVQRQLAAGLAAGLLLLVLLPSLLQVLHSIANAPNAEERQLTRISSWYGHDNLTQARASTAFSLRVLEAMAVVAAQLPEDACVSSTMAEMFMLHGRRLARSPPTQHAELVDLRTALAACPYVLLLGASTSLAADVPLYYPAARVGSELTTLLSVPLGGNDSKHPSVAILARYRAPSASTGEAHLKALPH
jgi:hypothetical protein